MNGSTTIELTCHSVDAEQFLAMGFSLAGQNTDGRVHMIHRAARREHVLALMTLSRYGLPFHGQADGNASAPPSVFSAADGTILCANLADCFGDPNRVTRYANHLARTQELMASRGRHTREALASV